MWPIVRQHGLILGLAGLALAALVSCGETIHATAPPGWQRTLQNSQRSTHGAWSVVRLKNGAELGGELLAIDDSTVFLGAAPTLARVPRGCVNALLASGFEGDSAGVLALGTAGFLSTASHGAFLILSAPVWLLSTLGLAQVQQGVGHESWFFGSARDLHGMARHARFPQGLPAAFNDERRVNIRDESCVHFGSQKASR